MKKEKIDFLKITPEEFDNYMCKTYMEFFGDRRKAMTQTCMCWGFEIGKGWYETLDVLCKKLYFIRKRTGIVVNFDQIKEKYGSGRFYFHIKTQEKKLSVIEKDVWCEIIDNIVSKAEDKVGHVCVNCGEDYYDKISSCGWVYDKCGRCLVKEGKFTQQQIDDIIKKNKK